jgi:hypothetical protein
VGVEEDRRACGGRKQQQQPHDGQDNELSTHECSFWGPDRRLAPASDSGPRYYL